MITVANRTETAARIKYAFDRKKVRIEALCDPERTLHIDSKTLGEAEAAEEILSGQISVDRIKNRKRKTADEKNNRPSCCAYK